MERYGFFIALLLSTAPLDKEWSRLENLRLKIALTEPYVSPADRLEEKKLSRTLLVKEKLLRNFSRSDNPRLKKALSDLMARETITQQDLERLQAILD